jgi:hypothetical protein
MGRILICALATLAVWVLLGHYASGFMGSLSDGFQLLAAMIVFCVAWYATGK